MPHLKVQLLAILVDLGIICAKRIIHSTIYDMLINNIIVLGHFIYEYLYVEEIVI